MIFATRNSRKLCFCLLTFLAREIFLFTHIRQRFESDFFIFTARRYASADNSTVLGPFVTHGGH